MCGRWLDWAADGNVAGSQLVSVAFVTPRWAGPVVDDQGNADQGKQHPQTQEEGRLQQQKGMGYFSEANISHMHLGNKHPCFPSPLSTRVFGDCDNHCGTVRIFLKLCVNLILQGWESKNKLHRASSTFCCLNWMHLLWDSVFNFVSHIGEACTCALCGSEDCRERFSGMLVPLSFRLRLWLKKKRLWKTYRSFHLSLPTNLGYRW